MSNNIEDLWPTTILPLTEEVPPLTILRQQASILGQKLKNIVEAEVETATTDYQRFLEHTFFLVAPALNFYRYPLFTVEHPVTHMYPATVKVTWLEKEGEDAIRITRTESEEEFKAELRHIFAEEETNRIIGALLTQSQIKREITAV